MKTTLRRLFSLLLVLLLSFSLTPGMAAADASIVELGAALLSTQTAYEEAFTAFYDLSVEVADLENQYNHASRKQQSALEDKWLAAMIEQEEAADTLAQVEDELTSLQAEHQALLLITDGLETWEVEYEGKFADMKLLVTFDEDMVIYDLSAEVDGSVRDRQVAGNVFLYQFLGKDLPLTIGNGKKDDVAPHKDAHQTSEDLVAALNSLVQEDKEEPAKAEGPVIEPQAIADYIFKHGKLPDNFITKKEAQKRGWDSRENYVSDVAPGYSIGGDRFGNYEGLLPSKKGRTWYEADCYYTRGKRNAHRILYSSDGLVYYTDDHYESFTQMHPSK